jgi:sulfite reductase (ferredoxin)
MIQTAIATQSISPDVEEEISHYEQETQRFLRGEVHAEVFRRFRLQHGIYGQRQDGVQMVRIKIPFGGMTAPQLRRVADIGDRYSRGVAHLTTRQDIQLHYIKLEYSAAIMRQLAEVGLTTREACGNTVRNVTACPYAGICRTK